MDTEIYLINIARLRALWLMRLRKLRGNDSQSEA